MEEEECMEDVMATNCARLDASVGRCASRMGPSTPAMDDEWLVFNASTGVTHSAGLEEDANAVGVAAATARPPTAAAAAAAAADDDDQGAAAAAADGVGVSTDGEGAMLAIDDDDDDDARCSVLTESCRKK